MLEDPLFWLFAAPGLLLGLYAQSLIKLNFTKYSQVPTRNGITGAQVARELLDAQGLNAVKIDSAPGMLSDHYDPRSKVLRLSQEVYNTPSLAAAGVAAHETGHALQDAVDYFPMELRSYIVPVVQLSAKIAPWLFLAGLILGITPLAWLGVILFGLQTLFTLLTLPVEFDASARARDLLLKAHIIEGDEQVAGVEKVLRAAAWTYVAGAVSAIGSLLYIVLLVFSTARRSS
ncbi:MAG: zinc metallopeptidase [Methyloceanibacter sp.]